MKKVILVLMLVFIGATYSFSVDVKIGKNNEILLDGKPFFPIGIWAQDESNFDKVIDTGVNTFATSINFVKTPKEYLDLCQKKGVYGVIDFHESVIEHPALLWWIHPDEPDMKDEKTGKPRISVEETLNVYKKIKEKDKKHLVEIGLTVEFNNRIEDLKGYKDNSFYKEYTKAAEIFGFDIYPIYQYNRPDAFWWLADSISYLRELTGDKYPICPRIEACEGSKWITPAKTREIFPYEIRNQAYMSIVRGAKVIYWWTHRWIETERLGNPKSNKRWDKKKDKYYSAFGVTPDNLKEMKKINLQIKKLTPVICSPDVTGKITSSNKDVEILVKEYSGKTYVFAVNMKMAPAEAKFTMSGLKKGAKIPVDEENREVTAGDGEFSDKFTDYAVHIYEIAQ